jgi:hypothetical protein
MYINVSMRYGTTANAFWTKVCTPLVAGTECVRVWNANIDCSSYCRIECGAKP